MAQQRTVGHSSKASSETGFRAELHAAEKLRPLVAVDRDEQDVTRLLHAPVDARGPRLTVGSSAFFTLLLGIVVIGGIAAIIWLRDFAERLGVNWD